MRISRQFEFFENKIPRHFGGSLLKGNAKSKRPLSTKHAIHLVMKSRYPAGTKSMLAGEHAGTIDRLLRRQAKACGVRIYHFVNVGNHLHLVVRIQSGKLFSRFLRAGTGLIARQVMKQQRGRGRKFLDTDPGPRRSGCSGRGSPAKFWMARPFTRLISWGRDYQRVAAYMEKNRSQARRTFVAWGFDVVDPHAIVFLNTG